MGRFSARKPGLTTPVGLTAVTSTDRPKSVCNRCVIEGFGGVFVVTTLFGFFFGCRGFCHRTESDLFLFLLCCIATLRRSTEVVHASGES